MDAVRGPSERMVNMAIDYASIGLRIKHARNKKGFTQQQLAETANLSCNHLSQIEAGEKGISLDLLISISNVLDTPISDLLADNLMGSEVTIDTDLHYLLLDCTAQEERIIIKTALALKDALRDKGI